MVKTKTKNLKIVTVNIREDSLEEIMKIIKIDKTYSSRSELIRVAVRDWLKMTVKNAEETLKSLSTPEKQLDPAKFVQVPHDIENKYGEIVREFRTYNKLREA